MRQGQCRKDGRQFGTHADGIRSRLFGGSQVLGEVHAEHPLTLAPGGQRQVFDHGVEKGGHGRGERETRKLPVDVSEGFLEHVQGVFLVSGEAKCETGNAIAIAIVKRVKRGSIAGIQRRNQFEIGSRVGGRRQARSALRKGGLGWEGCKRHRCVQARFRVCRIPTGGGRFTGSP